MMQTREMEPPWHLSMPEFMREGMPMTTACSIVDPVVFEGFYRSRDDDQGNN